MSTSERIAVNEVRKLVASKGLTATELYQSLGAKKITPTKASEAVVQLIQKGEVRIGKGNKLVKAE